MAKRLTRIYTRTGDDGSTGLADGRRLPKDHTRIDAIGAVDELNSAVGLLRAMPLEAETDRLLERFSIGCSISVASWPCPAPN